MPACESIGRTKPFDGFRERNMERTANIVSGYIGYVTKPDSAITSFLQQMVPESKSRWRLFSNTYLGGVQISSEIPILCKISVIRGIILYILLKFHIPVSKSINSLEKKLWLRAWLF